MEPERWQNIERLYHAALERPASLRTAFVAEACAGDESLRKDVESLLAHGEETGSFLEGPALEIAAKALAEAQSRLADAASQPDLMMGRMVNLSQQRYVPAVYMMAICVGLSDNDQALRWLKRALEDRCDYLIYAPYEPGLSLRSDPRFQDLMRQIHLTS